MTELVRVAVCGAAGRMGRMILRAALVEPGVRLAAAIVSGRCAELGADAGALVGLSPCGVALSADLDGALAAVDVVIDFTSPAATAAIAENAAKHMVALVVGTTGVDGAAERALFAATERVPVMRSANMSLGLNVLLGMLDRASRALSDYDAEIVEIHHRMKQDAPSGSALMMERAVASARGLDGGAVMRNGRSGQLGPRSDEEIGVLSLRGGDVVGEHTAFFFGPGERVELSHRATSREIFARGALRAARWICGRPAALYDMQDVLGLR